MFSIETLERILKAGLFSIERAEKYRRTIRKWQNAVINGATKYADMTIDMLDDYIDYARHNIREAEKDENRQDRSGGASAA